MILTHHPLIFKGIKQVSDQNFIGRRVLRMIQDDISYYAMHNEFRRSAGLHGRSGGKKKLGLTDCEVLENGERPETALPTESDALDASNSR